MTSAYENLIKNALACAAEASIRGEFEGPGSEDFCELEAHLYRAIFTATEHVLPEEFIDSFADEAETIALGRIVDVGDALDPREGLRP